VIEQAAFAGAIDAGQLRAAVKTMIEPLGMLMDDAYAMGIGELIAPKRQTVDNILHQLRRL
jgi:hypothetical protein